LLVNSVSRFLYGAYIPGNDLELILTVKMETRHPVEGSFGSKFPTICNHCGVIAAWSRNTLKFCEIFLFFFGKTTPYGKIFKILFRAFHRLTDWRCCSNFVKFGRREIGEIVRYLPDKNNKISPVSQTVATAWIAPKIYRGQPPTVYSKCSRFHPNRFTFGGLISERVNTAKSCPKVNPIFGGSLSSSRIKMIIGLLNRHYQCTSVPHEVLTLF